MPDLTSLGLSKLGRLLQESANIEPLLVGKALVYVGAVWVLLGASRSLDDISGKRTCVTLEALAKSQKPTRYDPALSFLLGSFGIQLETAPEASLPGFAGFVATPAFETWEVFQKVKIAGAALNEPRSWSVTINFDMGCFIVISFDIFKLKMSIRPE